LGDLAHVAFKVCEQGLIEHLADFATGQLGIQDAILMRSDVVDPRSRLFPMVIDFN
jgi:hypothetical protein